MPTKDAQSYSDECHSRRPDRAQRVPAAVNRLHAHCRAVVSTARERLGQSFYNMIAILIATCVLAAQSLYADEAKDLYDSKVKPLLAAKCLECHGPETQESHLRLDRRSSMLRGGDSGEPAIIVGTAKRVT